MSCCIVKTKWDKYSAYILILTAVITKIKLALQCQDVCVVEAHFWRASIQYWWSLEAVLVLEWRREKSARCILYFWCMSDGSSTISSLLFRSFLSLFRHQSHNLNWKCRHLSSSRLLHSSCVSSEPVMNPLLFEFPLPRYKMSLFIHPLFSSSLFLFLPLHLFSLHLQASFLARSHLNWGWFAGIMFS